MRRASTLNPGPINRKSPSIVCIHTSDCFLHLVQIGDCSWRIGFEMLHKVIPSAGLPSVDAYSDAIDRWLAKADNVKQQRGVEPALTAADFLDEIEEISRIRHKSGVSTQQAQYAAIETALRDKFYELLVRRPWRRTIICSDPMPRLPHPSIFHPLARHGTFLTLW